MRSTPWIVGCAVAIAVGGCGGSSGGPDGDGAKRLTTTVRDQGHGFDVTYPAAWHRAAHRLTPALADPREVISVGTGMLPAGGPCAQFPTRAVAAVSDDGAFVSVQIRSRRHDPSRAPLASRLTFRSGTPLANVECAGTPNRPVGRWIAFQDAGREVYAILVVGRHASPERRAQALAVLNSLRVLPAA